MSDNKPFVHLAAPYLINPVHRITVNLIGCGGSGSAMLSGLARLDHTMRKLGHRGLHVTSYDPDTVSETNVGRQLFAPAELGLNKAEALTTRLNRFYGLDWDAKDQLFDKNSNTTANIVISCVDTAKARLHIDSVLRPAMHKESCGEHDCYYWMDLGNGQNTGQIIMGTVAAGKKIQSNLFRPVLTLPTVTQEYNLENVNEEDNGPSCSMAEAIARQDIFINSTLSNIAATLLWNLLKNHMTDIRGAYLNLGTFRMSPIMVDGMPPRNK